MLAHKAFSDQEAARADPRQPGQIGRRGQAAFGHQQAVGGHEGGQLLGGFEMDLEGLEAAVGYLNEAADLAEGGVGNDIIKLKLKAINDRLSAIPAVKETALPTPPPIVQ